MIVGEIRNQIDGIWNDFWSGGLSNPLSVMEQITYLLFIKRLDELHTVEERKAATLKIDMERRIFPEGRDGRGDEELRKLGGRPYEDLRWSRFKSFDAKEMFKVVDEHVFPFIREKVAAEGNLAKHMKEARNAIPTPALLAKVVDKLDKVPMADRDTKGDVYEYMLGMIASAGQNGQFRTPRHIIKLMVELTEPTPRDVICDPAAGTCGFLVAAGEYLRERHPEIFRDTAMRRHFHELAFHGFDFDPTMLRIGSMNMILHGIENPVIEARTRCRKRSPTRKSDTVWSSPTRPLPARSITSRPPKTCNRRSKPKRPSCCFSRCSCGCCAPAVGRRSLCPMACCSVPPRPTRPFGRFWWKTTSWTR